jgi:hypothetical protein
MRNGILRDVVFACAGVLMVMAAIGLPRQGSAAQPRWQVNQSQCLTIKSSGQGAQLMPCYMTKPPPGVPARSSGKPTKPTPLPKSAP